MKKNKIIVHPDREGEIMFDVFVELGTLSVPMMDLLSDPSGEDDRNKWMIDAKDQGFRHIISISTRKYIQGRFLDRPRWLTKFDYNFVEPGKTWEHRNFSWDLSKIGESRYVPDIKPWQAIDVLIRHFGFAVEFSGWDESARYISRGVTSTSNPKVIRDWEGMFISNLKCVSCGDKTGCHCDDTLEEASKTAEESWYCAGCYPEYLYEQYLEAEEPGYMVKGWLRNMQHSEEPEIKALFATPSDWKRLATEQKDSLIDYISENNEGDDEGFCECPLGA